MWLKSYKHYNKGKQNPKSTAFLRQIDSMHFHSEEKVKTDRIIPWVAFGIPKHFLKAMLLNKYLQYLNKAEDKKERERKSEGRREEDGDRQREIQEKSEVTLRGKGEL